MKYFLFSLIAATFAGELNSQSMPVVKHSFDSLIVKIPGGRGERFTQVLANNFVTLFLYAPRKEDLQQPHERDEFYIVVKGNGGFWCDGIYTSFKEGDLLYAPMGKEHKFENFSDDLTVWVIFYGERSGPASNKEIVNRYLQSINQHDVTKIMSLQSSDHIFKDAHGNGLSGTDRLTKAWTDYFKLFPDYKIEIETISESKEGVVVFGHASASLDGRDTKKWKLPIAIRAKVKDSQISSWQIYADTKVPFDLIGKP